MGKRTAARKAMMLMTTRSSIRVKADSDRRRGSTTVIIGHFTMIKRLLFKVQSEVPTVRVRISGRVQGVGFRAFVMRLAREYHLRGEVWNSFDGTVGAVLQSENAGDLDRAVGLLKRGPGSVEDVESLESADEVLYEGFSVSHKRMA